MIFYVILLANILSIHFSSKYVGRVKNSYYWIFLLINILVALGGIVRIYCLSQNEWKDPEELAFPVMTMVLMAVQTIAVIIAALIANPLLTRWKRKAIRVQRNK